MRRALYSLALRALLEAPARWQVLFQGLAMAARSHLASSGPGASGAAQEASTLILVSTAAGAALLVELRMRERHRELACLHRLGFDAGALRDLLVLESTLIGGLAGAAAFLLVRFEALFQMAAPPATLPCLSSLVIGWAAGRIGSRGLSRLLHHAPPR